MSPAPRFEPCPTATSSLTCLSITVDSRTLPHAGPRMTTPKRRDALPDPSRTPPVHVPDAQLAPYVPFRYLQQPSTTNADSYEQTVRQRPQPPDPLVPLSSPQNEPDHPFLPSSAADKSFCRHPHLPQLVACLNTATAVLQPPWPLTTCKLCTSEFDTRTCTFRLGQRCRIYANRTLVSTGSPSSR